MIDEGSRFWEFRRGFAELGIDMATLASFGPSELPYVFSVLFEELGWGDSGLAISASNELGEMQSGIAAALLGATGAVVFGGAGAIVVTVLWAWMLPELRNARTFAPQFRQKVSDT